MYNEFICEVVPLLISGNDNWIKEHNREQLARSANYYELHGDKERAKEIREQMLKYF